MSHLAGLRINFSECLHLALDERQLVSTIRGSMTVQRNNATMNQMQQMHQMKQTNMHAKKHVMHVSMPTSNPH